jgi:general secretion pathway protein G
MEKRAKGRNGFTMIELIFVIVIIGILAIVSIPKLAATRDDALMTRKAQAIMTSASEIAAFVVAQGYSETELGKMSDTLRLMEQHGEANQTGNTPPTVVFPWKEIDDCITMKILNEDGGKTKVLVVEANGTSTNAGCNRFRSLIDTERFPIPLRGMLVSY